MPDHDFHQRLIMQLREEAAQVKKCFTDFSFQAIAFSTALLGAMFAAREDLPLVDLAVIPMIGLLATVCRIGLYKYSSANRQIGYELHLARTEATPRSQVRDSAANHPPEALVWGPLMRNVTWEEALRAWRIVQPAIFSKIYKTPDNTPFGRFCIRWLLLRWLNSLWPTLYGFTTQTRSLLKRYGTPECRQARRASLPEYAAKGGEYPWFLPRELAVLEERARFLATRSYYYAGSYLRNMLVILILMQVLGLVPLSLSVFEWLQGGEPKTEYGPLRAACLVVLTVFVVARAFRVLRRAQILQDGLLSIHSCAITWQAVVLAHFRGLSKMGRYHHYTEALAIEAQELEHHAFRIHDWIDGKTGS